MPYEVGKAYSRTHFLRGYLVVAAILVVWLACAANPYLPKLFDVLSTNKDRNNLVFISTVEAKGGLPIFATQWHPEKPQ